MGRTQGDILHYAFDTIGLLNATFLPPIRVDRIAAVGFRTPAPPLFAFAGDFGGMSGPEGVCDE